MTAAATLNRALARTINIGVDLGADLERGWSLPNPHRYLPACRAAGFGAVRLTVAWAAHTDPNPPYRVDPTALDAVATVVDSATEQDLAVVVANHRDPDLMSNPGDHHDRLLAATRQVAAHLRTALGMLALEPLAEPCDALDPLWNAYLAELITTVREVDPQRALVVGPGFYNTVLHLDELTLPADDNLILTVHQYWPIPFTMQGEAWFTGSPGWQWLGGGGPAGWRGTTWTGTDTELAELATGYDRIAGYAADRGLPVFLGEFGATRHADARSRARWAQVNRTLAEARGFSWGWWSLAPTFALYNTTTDTWDQQLLAALIGQPKEQGL